MWAGQLVAANAEWFSDGGNPQWSFSEFWKRRAENGLSDGNQDLIGIAANNKLWAIDVSGCSPVDPQSLCGMTDDAGSFPPPPPPQPGHPRLRLARAEQKRHRLRLTYRTAYGARGYLGVAGIRIGAHIARSYRVHHRRGRYIASVRVRPGLWHFIAGFSGKGRWLDDALCVHLRIHRHLSKHRRHYWTRVRFHRAPVPGC